MTTTLTRIAPVVLLAAALAGCIAYVPRPMSTQQTLAELRGRSLADERLIEEVSRHLGPRAARPPVWTFESLTWAAYRLNPEIAIARARVEVARAAETTAAERPNPTLSLPFAYTTNPKADESPYTWGLALDMTVETGGKRSARRAQAGRLTEAAEFELGSTAWRIRGRLRDALLDWRHALNASSLLDAQAARRSQVVELLDRRVAFGEAAQVDLVQARTELLQARQQLAEAQRATLQAQAAVADAIGVPLTVVAHADVRLDSLEGLGDDVSVAAIQDDALKNRADVQGALAEYEASQAALQVAIASQYPDLHLGPGYTFDAGAHKYALSVSGIELPLFSQHRGAIDEARARRQEASARFETVMAQALAQVDRAEAAMQNVRVQWTLATQQAQDQQRLALAALQSFRVGATSRLDLALAGLQADAAALQREDSLDRLYRSMAALEDAIQRPLAGGPDILPLEHR